MDDAIHCSRCDRDLDPEAFTPSQRKPGAYCRQCQKAYHADWHRRTNPLTCRDCGAKYERWSDYGASRRRCRPCYNDYSSARYHATKTAKVKPAWTHDGCDPLDVYGEKPKPSRYWRRLQAQVWTEESTCGICGEVVDQTLPPRDKRARCVDHIVPIVDGGATYQRSNLRLAHIDCNARLGNQQGRRTPVERLAFARVGAWLAVAADW